MAGISSFDHAAWRIVVVNTASAVERRPAWFPLFSSSFACLGKVDV